MLYAVFIQWFWGWSWILSAWRDVGLARTALALFLLVATYLIRAHRIMDYFVEQTRGHFLKLFRVTQIHNLLNIMLPLRAGETSFPILMRSEFGVPLAHGAAALLVLRLLDLHALLACAGAGMILAGRLGWPAWIAWLAFLFLPLCGVYLRSLLISLSLRDYPARVRRLLAAVADGIPPSLSRFARAWTLTVLNWSIKVAVLAWILYLMGVPLLSGVGGALFGELSSVLPIHAPGGVGTYPAAVAVGASAFGAVSDIAQAAVNMHLLMVVSALFGTALALVLPMLSRSNS